MNEQEQAKLHEELRRIVRLLDRLLELEENQLEKLTEGLKEVNEKLDQL